MPEIIELDSSPCSATSSEESTSSSTSSTVSKKSWVKPYDLPPCKVCGGKGTGFHYGVNTCEPCKVFFRRSLGKGQKKACRKDSRCQLVDGKKNLCAQCRFTKCVEVGMSLEGIKNGRYTLGKKLADIQDMQKLKAEQALVSLLVLEERTRPGLEKTVGALYNHSQRFTDLWEPAQEQLLQMDIEFLEKFGVHRSMMEDMAQVVRGDPRISFLDDVLNFSERVCRQTVRFAKQLPGYRDLNMDDQIILLQESFVDIRLINTYRTLAPSTGILNTHQVYQVFGEASGRLVINMCNRLVDLQLKPEELAVLTAILIFTTDRDVPLKEPDHVAVINSQLVDALRWLLHRNHPNDKLCFAKIVGIMTQFRTFTEYCMDSCKHMMRLSDEGIIHIPQLVKELSPAGAK